MILTGRRTAWQAQAGDEVAVAAPGRSWQSFSRRSMRLFIAFDTVTRHESIFRVVHSSTTERMPGRKVAALPSHKF
jgi:hypothetical protein